MSCHSSVILTHYPATLQNYKATRSCEASLPPDLGGKAGKRVNSLPRDTAKTTKPLDHARQVYPQFWGKPGKRVMTMKMLQMIQRAIRRPTMTGITAMLKMKMQSCMHLQMLMLMLMLCRSSVRSSSKLHCRLSTRLRRLSASCNFKSKFKMQMQPQSQSPSFL